MSRRLELILLTCLFGVALALRLYDLRGAPPGAQHDEVFSANFATQIVNGARPVYFDQNGGVMAFYAYLVAPVFAVFGANIITLRLVSVACGIGVVLFTYLTAHRLFGVKVALLSSAFLAVSHWQLFESRVGLEPIALQLMAILTAWFFWQSSSSYGILDSGARPPPSRLQYPLANLLVGISLGLTTYTYHSAPLVFVAFSAFISYLLVWQRASVRAHWKGLLLVVVVALCVMAPLAWHVTTTPGDAISRTEDLAADLRAVLAGDFEPLFNNVVGVLGMFAFTGDPSWRYNTSGRPVFTFIVGLCAYLGFARCARRWREPRYAFVVIWITCNVLASAVTRASPSYLRSSAALPFIVMLPALALCAIRSWILESGRRKFSSQYPMLKHRLTASNLQRPISNLQSLMLITSLLLWETLSTTQAYFTLWAQQPQVRLTYRADLAEVAEYLDTQQFTGVVMVSARFPADLDQQALYLLQRKPQRYQWFNGRRVFVLPNERSGQGVNYIIPATNLSLGDGAALLKTLDARVSSLNEQGEPFFTLYYMPDAKLHMLRRRAPQISLRANANHEVELMGVDMAMANRSVHVLLYWRVLQRVRGDVDRSFFVHLIDAEGKRWAQEDRAVYPTSSWRDDDIVWQWYDLKLPEDAPNGEYGLIMGIYSANTMGQPRVPILDAAGNVMSDHLRVGPIVIQ
jgi:4-amino-4-deoxy-L-arabinose transferase-like glycosyltransferase